MTCLKLHGWIQVYTSDKVYRATYEQCAQQPHCAEMISELDICMSVYLYMDLLGTCICLFILL
jgi:hypothetical protein